MCDKVDMGVKTCCAPAKTLLLISGICQIVFGAIVSILVFLAYKEVISGQLIALGIWTIIIIYFPYKILVVLSIISQIFMAVITIIIAIIVGTWAGVLTTAAELEKKSANPDQKKIDRAEYASFLSIFIFMGFAISAAICIVTAVFYIMVLCKGGRVGGSSSFSSGTS